MMNAVAVWLRHRVPEKDQVVGLQRWIQAFSVKNVNAYYGESHALKDVNFDIGAKTVTAIIGPSGCGKSTFIRCLNRMNDLVPSFRLTGDMLYNGTDIYEKGEDIIELRRKIGMVFQKPNPFPKSIYENVAYGLRIHGIKDKSTLDGVVEKSLKKAALWEDVKDRLKESALMLSGGQQQRLCIARAIATEPEVILFDEPCSALDPISTSKVEDLFSELKDEYTVIIVTHSMQQAARVSDFTGFFMMGELIEFDETKKIFTTPS